MEKEGKEYLDWIKKAESDFETAIYNLDGGKIDSGIFFLQQAVEKSLKAIYIKKFKSLLKTHDLVLLSKKINAPEKIQEYCIKLNPAYQYTRYPDMPSVENLIELSENLVVDTKEILKWVKKNI